MEVFNIGIDILMGLVVAGGWGYLLISSGAPLGLHFTKDERAELRALKQANEVRRRKLKYEQERLEHMQTQRRLMEQTDAVKEKQDNVLTPADEELVYVQKGDQWLAMTREHYDSLEEEDEFVVDPRPYLDAINGNTPADPHEEAHIEGQRYIGPEQADGTRTVSETLTFVGYDTPETPEVGDYIQVARWYGEPKAHTARIVEVTEAGAVLIDPPMKDTVGVYTRLHPEDLANSSSMYTFYRKPKPKATERGPAPTAPDRPDQHPNPYRLTEADVETYDRVTSWETLAPRNLSDHERLDGLRYRVPNMEIIQTEFHKTHIPKPGDVIVIRFRESVVPHTAIITKAPENGHLLFQPEAKTAEGRCTAVHWSTHLYEVWTPNNKETTPDKLSGPDLWTYRQVTRWEGADENARRVPDFKTLQKHYHHTYTPREGDVIVIPNTWDFGDDRAHTAIVTRVNEKSHISFLPKLHTKNGVTSTISPSDRVSYTAWSRGHHIGGCYR